MAGNFTKLCYLTNYGNKRFTVTSNFIPYILFSLIKWHTSPIFRGRFSAGRWLTSKEVDR